MPHDPTGELFTGDELRSIKRFPVAYPEDPSEKEMRLVKPLPTPGPMIMLFRTLAFAPFTYTPPKSNSSIIELWTATFDPSMIPIERPVPQVVGGVPPNWLRIATFFTVPDDFAVYAIPNMKILPELFAQGRLFPALSIARLLMLTLIGAVTATCAARLPNPSDAARPAGGVVITGALELLAFNPESVNGIEMAICSG